MLKEYREKAIRLQQKKQIPYLVQTNKRIADYYYKLLVVDSQLHYYKLALHQSFVGFYHIQKFRRRQKLEKQIHRQQEQFARELQQEKSKK